MKKVLSAIMAAAMIMGMSVSAMAATYGGGVGSTNQNYDIGNVVWGPVYQYRDNAFVQHASGTTELTDLQEGDVLYFAMLSGDTTNSPLGWATGVDKNWKIKINNAEYVEDAEFFFDDKNKLGVEDAIYVKVTLEDDFDALEEDEVKFYFYVYDSAPAAGHKDESEYVYVNYDFVDYETVELTSAKLDWVITVDEDKIYKYVGTKAKKATVDFDGIALGEFKMWNNEKYTLAAKEAYNKALSKELDTEVSVVTFKLGNVENIDLVFPASKDNKQIVAVVDGEVVPVEATYVEDHKFESGEVVDGYLVEDAEYTAYAVISADVEIAVEEEVVETPVVEDTKANPETGASDFVGAAVALAVVSVAAAGALALKK